MQQRFTINTNINLNNCRCSLNFITTKQGQVRDGVICFTELRSLLELNYALDRVVDQRERKSAREHE